MIVRRLIRTSRYSIAVGVLLSLLVVVGVLASSTLTITYPSTGDTVEQGKVITIKWSGAEGSHAKIWIKSPQKLLVSKTSNGGSWDWTVPADQTPGTYTIKIDTFTNHWICQYFDENDMWGPYENWGLHKYIYFKWKNVDESDWGAGAGYGWSSLDSLKDYLNSKAGWTTIDIDGNVCTSSKGSTGEGGNFTVSKPDTSSISVTTPNGGQKWKTGKSYTLKWTHKTAGDNVKIQLLKSGKQYKWISTSTENDGEHSWKIPSAVATGSAYTIKITSTSKTTVTDTSNKNFTITKGDDSKLTVVTPNGGQKWKTGKSYTLKWTHKTAGAKVKIQLLKSGKHSLWISKSTKNDGKHVWKIPATVATGSAYTIKITSTSKKTVTDTSNKNFKITKTKSDNSKLTVTVPNGGQKWETGKSYTLKWTHKTAGAKVKIELLKSGKHSLWISKSTKNDGNHSWKIPATVATGSAYKIKITSTSKKTVTDTSNKNFTITKKSDDDDDSGGV